MFPRLAVLVMIGWTGACAAPAPTVVLLERSPARALPNAADPALVADPGTGDLLLAFVGGSDSAGWQLYFTRSSDGGLAWTDAVAVTTDPHEVHPHGEASPRLVAASGGRIALVWAQNLKVEGRKWPASRIRFARSVDGGANWSAPITINDDTTGSLTGHTFQGATWVGDSGFVAAWLDERGIEAPAVTAGDTPHQHDETAESDAAIYAVSSPDFGTTWTANQPLWGAVCPCCRVTLARDQDGTVLAAWRKHFPGNVRDIVIGPLADRGVEPIRVRDDNWVYPGCPHSGPSLSMGPAGTPHVAWYTGRPGGAGVYLSRGSRSLQFGADPLALVTGDRLPTAHPAVVALADGGSVVAWDIDRKGNRHLTVAHVRSGANRAQTTAVPGTSGATYPQLAPLRDGGAAIAWSQLVGETRQLGLARLEVRRQGREPR